MTKINAKTAVPLALVICFGMSVFWLIGRALADELDPILGVASFASMSSLARTFLVAITVAIYAMDKKSTHSWAAGVVGLIATLGKKVATVLVPRA
jgi:hypothetical protein